MRQEDKQEQLSLAVLHATCAKAGFGFKISGRIQDNWGWDAEADVFEKLHPESILTDFKIKFQAKATRQQLTLTRPDRLERHWCPRREGGCSVRTRSEKSTDRHFQMPDNESEWLEASPEQLILRRCLRYVSLRNAPPTSNKTIVTVHLPAANVLIPETLRDLARKRSRNQWIEYATD